MGGNARTARPEGAGRGTRQGRNAMEHPAGVAATRGGPSASAAHLPRTGRPNHNAAARSAASLKDPSGSSVSDPDRMAETRPYAGTRWQGRISPAAMGARSRRGDKPLREAPECRCPSIQNTAQSASHSPLSPYVRRQKICFVEYILWRKDCPGRRFAAMAGDARRLIARNVRKLRSMRGMTQEDLAAAAAIDRSYISEIENERYSISVDQVEKLAAVFGVDIYEMFHPATADKVIEADGP